MIIATAIGKIVEGMTVDVVNMGQPIADHPTYYHFGDQKELLLWIKTRGNLGKYPLIWYVLNDYTKENDWYVVDAKVVIMQHTKGDPLNTWRQSNSYVGIINPVAKAFQERLETNVFVTIPRFGFSFKDEPNYGVSPNGDLEAPSSDRGISTDIVDARVIRFDLRIKAECLI
jgi:hypothetical protein